MQLMGRGSLEEIPSTPPEELIPCESVNGIEGATDIAELQSTDTSEMVVLPTPKVQTFRAGPNNCGAQCETDCAGPSLDIGKDIK